MVQHAISVIAVLIKKSFFLFKKAFYLTEFVNWLEILRVFITNARDLRNLKRKECSKFCISSLSSKLNCKRTLRDRAFSRNNNDRWMDMIVEGESYLWIFFKTIMIFVYNLNNYHSVSSRDTSNDRHSCNIDYHDLWTYAWSFTSCKVSHLVNKKKHHKFYLAKPTRCRSNCASWIRGWDNAVAICLNRGDAVN